MDGTCIIAGLTFPPLTSINDFQEKYANGRCLKFCQVGFIGLSVHVVNLRISCLLSPQGGGHGPPCPFPWIRPCSVLHAKKIIRLYSFSGQFEAINRNYKLLWSQLMTKRGYLPVKPLQGVIQASIALRWQCPFW